MEMNKQEKTYLERLYKETLKDCGKNPSKEFIEQEFLAFLKERGKIFLNKYRLN